MAKSKQKTKARKLRRQGKSIKKIAKMLDISKSSASIWCRDIELTNEQIETLRQSMIKGSYAGRMKGARMQKERKEEKINNYIKQGQEDIGSLSPKEFFVAGLALYWGEGGKKNPATRFYNSNPEIIKFIMKWFKESLNVSEDRFLMYVTINKIHRNRLKEVNKHWSNITSIPLKQFKNPILIKAKNKKTYDNFNQHFGTLCIRIAKSTDLYYKILGWLKGMEETK
jgi:hypothetical protein